MEDRMETRRDVIEDAFCSSWVKSFSGPTYVTAGRFNVSPKKSGSWHFWKSSKTCAVTSGQMSAEDGDLTASSLLVDCQFVPAGPLSLSTQDARSVVHQQAFQWHFCNDNICFWAATSPSFHKQSHRATMHLDKEKTRRMESPPIRPYKTYVIDSVLKQSLCAPDAIPAVLTKTSLNHVALANCFSCCCLVSTYTKHFDNNWCVWHHCFLRSVYLLKLTTPYSSLAK